MRGFDRNALFVTSAIVCAVAATPAAAQTKSFDVPAQAVQSAIAQLGRQADIQIIAARRTTRGKEANAVRGEMTFDVALAALLRGTGLTARRTGSQTYTVVQAGEATDATPVPADTSQSRSASSSATEEASQIEEIIVTAQKRKERLQDVPAPVAVLSAAELTNQGQLSLQDYYTQIPGLNFAVAGDIGLPLIAFRGVTTGSTAVNPTVSVVVDDIPFGASSTAASSIAGYAPDFDPSELERIEALRGPQGTLYGASSLGGLLKYVTVDPTTDRVKGQVQLGTSLVEKGDFGYSVRGALNAPISDAFAVRISGSARRDPGYIDNLSTGEKDINDLESYSAHMALMWRPSPGVSVKLSALYQQAERGGTSDSYLPTGPRPDVGDLEQATLINTGGSKDKLLALSAIATADVMGGELVSLTGYSKKSGYFSGDSTIGLAAQSSARFGVRGLDIRATTEVEKVSQELRFSRQLGERLDLIVGGFFTKETVDGGSEWYAVNETTGAIGGTWQLLELGGGYREYAAFGDLSYRFTDQFDIQVGGRASWNRVEGGSLSSVGPYNLLLGRPSETFTSPSFVAKDSPTTFLVTARYRPSSDLTLYGRIASGYRPGGPNTNTQLMLAGLPEQFEADTTINYEIGAKGSLFDKVLTFDASIYRIDWDDVQLTIRDLVTGIGTLQYTVNGGKARIEGVEFSAGLRPFRGTLLSGWVAYNDAKITGVPGNVNETIAVGDRLPYSPRWSGNVSLNQEFELGQGATAFVGGAASFVGNRRGRFFRGFPQSIFPGYTQFDLSAGVNWNDWSVNAYLNNVTDKRGVLRAGRDSLLSQQYIITYIRPRTAGISLSRKF